MLNEISSHKKELFKFFYYIYNAFILLILIVTQKLGPPEKIKIGSTTAMFKFVYILLNNLSIDL